MGRRVMYTVLTGGYETILEQPATTGSNIERICFTDNPTLTSATWSVCQIAPAFAGDPVRSAREPKILAHRFLHEYDASLYLDNSVLLLQPPEEIFDALLPTDQAMALLRHSYRGPVAEEFAAVNALALDSHFVCDEQAAHYADVDPGSLSAPTLWTGLLLRRHGDALVRTAMELWFRHVLRYSRRDQLSLPFVLRATGLAPVVHELDNNLSPYHRWPHWAEGAPRAIDTLPTDPATERVSALEKSLNVAAEERVALARELADAQHARADLVERAAHLATIARDAQLRAAEIERSTSWRITAPLRAVARQWAVRRRALARESRPGADPSAATVD